MKDFDDGIPSFDEYKAPSYSTKNNDGIPSFDEYVGAQTPTLKPGNFVTDTLQDIGRGALKLPGTVTGLADIPAGLAGLDRPFSRAADIVGERTGFQPGKWAEQTQYSPERQQSMQNTREAWDAYNRGETSLPSAIGSTLANPRAVVGNIAESLPSMVAGGLGARALIGAKALAPAVGEGAVMAGQQMQNIDPSVDPQKAAALSLGTGVAGAGLGYTGGRVAEKMGLIDPDTLIARGLTPAAANAMQPNLAKRIGLGAVQEGLLEELPQSLVEQGSQNIAEDRPFTEGMAEAGVQGTLAGGIMGGGFNAAAGPLSRAATKAAIDANPTADADTIINQAREIANAADVNLEGAATDGSPTQVRTGAPTGGRVSNVSSGLLGSDQGPVAGDVSRSRSGVSELGGSHEFAGKNNESTATISAIHSERELAPQAEKAKVAQQVEASGENANNNVSAEQNQNVLSAESVQKNRNTPSILTGADANVDGLNDLTQTTPPATATQSPAQDANTLAPGAIANPTGAQAEPVGASVQPVLSKQGKPFSTKKVAQLALESSAYPETKATHEIVKVEGGYGLAPKTQAKNEYSETNKAALSNAIQSDNASNDSDSGQRRKKLVGKSFYTYSNDNSTAYIYAPRKDTGKLEKAFTAHPSTIDLIKKEGLQSVIDKGLLRAYTTEHNVETNQQTETPSPQKESRAQPEQSLKRKLIEQRFTADELTDLRQKAGEVRDINRYASGRYGADKVKGVDLRDYFAQPVAPTPAKTPEVEANQKDAVAETIAEKTPNEVIAEKVSGAKPKQDAHKLKLKYEKEFSDGIKEGVQSHILGIEQSPEVMAGRYAHSNMAGLTDQQKNNFIAGFKLAKDYVDELRSGKNLTLSAILKGDIIPVDFEMKNDGNYTYADKKQHAQKTPESIHVTDDVHKKSGEVDTKKEPSSSVAEESTKRDEGRVAPIIAKDDIPYDTAYRAYSGISFDPDKRAKSTQEEYVNYMQSVYDDVIKIAKTDEQRATIDAAFETYRQGYVQKQLAHLQAKSRVISPMISGPANFPVRRNEKANAAEQKRLDEFLEWDKKALKRLKDIAKGTRSTEEITDERFGKIKQNIERSLSTIKGIDEGTVKGSTRSLFVNSVTGLIKTLSKNGEVDLVNKALDVIQDYQNGLKKPLITPQNSIWTLRNQAPEVQDPIAKQSGTTTLKTYQGAEVVNNFDAERVQILFDEKPSEQVRNALKKEAFKWSPSNNAWQRQNTPNGIATAKRVLDGLYQANETKLSQSQSTTGSTVAELTAKLDAADKKLLQSGKLNIVQKATDVPDSAVSIDANGIEGFYLAGKVYVVADNVTPSSLQSVLRHEYLHSALAENPKLRERILGAQSELRDIFAQVEAGKYTGRYKALYDAALRRVNRAQTSKADRFEEWLAYQVTQHNKSPQSLPERLAKAIQNLVAAIRAAIFKYSGKIDKIGPAELSALAKSAISYSENSNSSMQSVNNAQSPDIRYSIADDVRESAEKLTANLVDRLSTDKTFNWWHKTVGTQFHKALVDKHFGKVFNRSMQFEQDMARLANEAADLAPSLLPKLDALSDVGKELKEFAQGAIKGQAGRRMIDARKIGEAVFQTTLQDKPMTEKELIDAGYTESQRTMYHEFFAAVNRSLDDLAKSELFRMARALKIGQAPSNLSLKDTANWYAEQAEDANQGKDFIDKAAQVEKLKKQGYAPLMRFGQYTLDVVTPKADGTEKREFFGLFETEQEAKEMEKAMRAEYPDSNIERGVMSQNDWQMFKGVTPETMEVFAKMMNVEQDEAFQAYLKSAVTNRSAMKRLIHRKKMPGFAKDTQRILASFLTSNARAASKNYHLGDLVDAISTIPKAKGDVIDEAVELYNYVQNPSAKGAVIRGLMFAWYLGGSVSSAAVNLTQSFTTTLPYLHQFGDTKQVSRLMGQAMKLAANHRAIQGDLANALKLADEEGITDPKELHMLYGESMRTGMLKNQFLRPLSKAWGSFFSLAETYNRRVAFIAAYNLAKETNQPGPFQFAANAVNETQFVYNKSSRPNWARSTIGSTVFTFKTFTINYLEFLKRLPAKERVIALGVLVAFAGLSGAPGADDLDDLIDTFGQAMGYNTNSKAWKDRVLSDFIGKEAAQYALYGLSHGLPIDVSSRLSVGNIIPGSSLFKKSEIDKSRDVMEFAGPAGSLSKRIVDAFEAAGSRDSFTGQASAVGRAVIPKAMSDLAQAIDMQITGQYRDTRGRKVAEADLPDVLAKALGFQPTSVAEPRRAERYLNQSVTMAKTVEADIAGLWASGIVEQNRDKVGEAKAMLKDWNDKNPETPIKVKLNQVLRRVKQMRMTSGERLLKSTPKEIRRYAREALND
jgi:hypothetical protein